MNKSLPGEAAVPDAKETPIGDLSGAAILPGGQSLFLVGMMGAGKTTIGRQLARLLNREFVELDQELEARCGVKESLMFEIEGEEGFRRRAALRLEECTRRTSIVIEPGWGGVR